MTRSVALSASTFLSPLAEYRCWISIR